MLRGPDQSNADTTIADGFTDKGIADKHLAGMRRAMRPDGSLRVVLDLWQGVRPKSFLLKPRQQYGHRLVVDLPGVEYMRDLVERDMAAVISEPGQLALRRLLKHPVEHVRLAASGEPFGERPHRPLGGDAPPPPPSLPQGPRRSPCRGRD